MAYYFRELITSDSVTISEVNGTFTVFIKNPDSNMQTDAACFESIALILKTKYNPKEIQIAFTPVNWDGKFENLCAQQSHYMRFLFRLMKFTSSFTWATVANENETLVAAFAAVFSTAQKVANYPEKSGGFNAKKGKEHVIENAFAQGGCCNLYFKELFSRKIGTDLSNVYNQFPNGLFTGKSNDKLHNKNRIFPTGYFDLWSIDKNGDICIFELKKNEGNAKIGLLTELFFYAVFAKELLWQGGCLGESKNDFRGYLDFKNALKNCTKVRAFFLAGKEIHPMIRENQEALLTLLNQYDRAVEFDFLFYDYAEMKAQLIGCDNTSVL